MTDIRTFSASSSSTTNNGVSSNAAPPLPADLTNVSGLTNYVNTIFRQMEDKFTAASDQVMNRMNELGRKIDTLESNIGDIISHLPTEESTTTTTTGPPGSQPSTTAVPPQPQTKS